MFIKKHKKHIKVFSWILFGCYIILLVYFLFFAEMLGRGEIANGYHYNLVPFKEITRFWVYRRLIGTREMIMNLIGNIVIFIPFGFLVPMMGRKLRGFFHVVLLGFELTLAVECIQLFTQTGSFDVDDMILNTLGVVSGYILVSLSHYIWAKHVIRPNMPK